MTMMVRSFKLNIPDVVVAVLVLMLMAMANNEVVVNADIVAAPVGNPLYSSTMFSSKTLQLFLSMTAFAAISSPTSVLAAPVSRQSKSSKKSKSSKSAPPLPGDLPPPCEGLGDPVYSPPAAPQVFPSEFVRTYTGTVPSPNNVETFFLNTAGAVDVTVQSVVPCGTYGPNNNAFPADAMWCNTDGQQKFLIPVHGSCVHDITDDYYYMKAVLTAGFAPTGLCRLFRVSRKTPGTWNEYQTPEMYANGGAIEWAYDADPVGVRYKFSLCPDPGDKNVVHVVGATFV